MNISKLDLIMACKMFATSVLFEYLTNDTNRAIIDDIVTQHKGSVVKTGATEVGDGAAFMLNMALTAPASKWVDEFLETLQQEADDE